MQQTFWYISLPSLHDYDESFLLFLNLNVYLKNLTPVGEFVCI